MTKSRNINRKAWKPTDDELASFRALYPSTTSKALAERFGVAVTQVCSLAHRLGLKKSAEFLASPASGRLDGVRGSANRFQKGGESWNKGRKLPGHGSPVAQFKPGQMPHNHLPIGSFRIAVGYLQIKLTDTGYPPRDWVMYHRHVWAQVHGPIPEGHMVVFKGERLTEAALITADGLECVTREEHMRRHTFHRYGPEIAGLVLARSALSRQINKRARHGGPQSEPTDKEAQHAKQH